MIEQKQLNLTNPEAIKEPSPSIRFQRHSSCVRLSLEQQRQAEEGGNMVTLRPSWRLAVAVRLLSASGEQSQAAPM